jgi:predicted O-linked N-acetylglucosamine transferase (SPINDLY family)
VSGSSAQRADLGLPESAVVLCSFNNNYKITPTIFDLWCRILSRSEGACLWLLASTSAAEANLRREARARGLEEDRLVFARKLPHGEHLSRLSAADLVLDTFPCNAHTTASDALRAGLPVLTLAGESFASRVAASLLRAVDLPELVTFTPEDYERTALELAADTNRLRALRTRLAENREKSTLLDTRRFTQGFESALTKMHERQQRRESQRPSV